MKMDVAYSSEAFVTQSTPVLCHPPKDTINVYTLLSWKVKISNSFFIFSEGINIPFHDAYNAWVASVTVGWYWKRFVIRRTFLIAPKARMNTEEVKWYD